MKIINLIFTGLILTITSLSQSAIKVRFTKSKMIYHTSMIIPCDDKFLYEDYSYFKYVYWLHKRDTLIAIDDSTLQGDSITVKLDSFKESYDFCDTTINYIRNSSLSHRLFSMAYDTCRKYIGGNNREFEEYIREVSIKRETEKSICSDEFVQIANKKFNLLNNKVNEIYERKLSRTKWIENNPEKINEDFIQNFLKDFDSNIPDKESFISILILKPSKLISVIDSLGDSYQIIWNLRNLPDKKLAEAISVLEKNNFKGKTPRRILKKLKNNKTEN